MPRVSYITHIPHFITHVHEIPVYNIKGDIGPCMPEVALPAHGRSANIHTHVARMQGDKYFFLPGERVIYFKFGHNGKCRINWQLAIGNWQLATEEHVLLLPIAYCQLLFANC